MEYFFADGDVQKGPYSLDELRPHLRPETLVWREGLQAWQRADGVPELKDLIPRPAPEPSPASEPIDPFPQASAPAAAGPFDPQPAYIPAPQPMSPQTYPHQPYPQQQYAAPQYPQGGYGQPQYGQPAYGQQLQYGGYAPVGQPPLTSGMAVTSMVLGIIAIPGVFIYCLGIPCAILAIIFGHIARGKANRGEAAGGGMAMAGLICGYISVGLIVVFLLFFLAAFSAG